MKSFANTQIFKVLQPFTAPLNRLHGHLPERTVALLGEIAVALLFGWLLVGGITWLETLFLSLNPAAAQAPIWVSLLQLVMTVTKLAMIYWLVGYLTSHTLALHDLPGYYSLWIMLGLVALVTIILRTNLLFTAVSLLLWAVFCYWPYRAAVRKTK